MQSEIAFHDLTVKIFDLQGRVVRQIEHQSGSEISLQRDGLVEGIYFVQLVEGKRIFGLKKVIVGE